MDFDKNASLHVRDNGVVSSVLLRAVMRLLLKTAGSTSHLMLGVTLLEAMVHRAVKRVGSKVSTGILVTDVEVRQFGTASHHMRYLHYHCQYLHIVTKSL